MTRDEIKKKWIVIKDFYERSNEFFKSGKVLVDEGCYLCGDDELEEVFFLISECERLEARVKKLEDGIILIQKDFISYAIEKQLQRLSELCG